MKSLKISALLGLAFAAACSDAVTGSGPLPRPSPTSEAGMSEVQRKWHAMSTAEREAGMAIIERIAVEEGLRPRSGRVVIASEALPGGVDYLILNDPAVVGTPTLVLSRGLSDNGLIAAFEEWARVQGFSPRAIEALDHAAGTAGLRSFILSGRTRVETIRGVGRVAVLDGPL